GPIAKPALTEALPNVLNHWFGKANYTFFWKTPQYFDYSPLQFTISRKDYLPMCLNLLRSAKGIQLYQ
ncbi:MAG: hypothetical protein PUH92_01645, partial [Bacilli bacterium]|nr:hypothetical protein [Bacilli bacterium]